MVVFGNHKYACLSCIRGHRSSSCVHRDRILLQVRKPGRKSQAESQSRYALVAKEASPSLDHSSRDNYRLVKVPDVAKLTDEKCIEPSELEQADDDDVVVTEKYVFVHVGDNMFRRALRQDYVPPTRRSSQGSTIKTETTPASTENLPQSPALNDSQPIASIVKLDSPDIDSMPLHHDFTHQQVSDPQPDLDISNGVRAHNTHSTGAHNDIHNGARNVHNSAHSVHNVHNAAHGVLHGANGGHRVNGVADGVLSIHDSAHDVHSVHNGVHIHNGGHNGRHDASQHSSPHASHPHHGHRLHNRQHAQPVDMSPTPPLVQDFNSMLLNEAPLIIGPMQYQQDVQNRQANILNELGISAEEATEIWSGEVDGNDFSFASQCVLPGQCQCGDTCECPDCYEHRVLKRRRTATMDAV